MKLFLLVLCSVLMLASCGSTSGNEGINIEEIRARLDENACRIMREELVFQLGELEFTNDTTYSVLPSELLADSLLVCPVTLETFMLVTDGNDRQIECPSVHGKTEF